MSCSVFGNAFRYASEYSATAMKVWHMEVNRRWSKTNGGGQNSRQQHQVLKPHYSIAVDGVDEILDVSAVHCTPIKPWCSENGRRDKILQILPLVHSFGAVLTLRARITHALLLQNATSSPIRLPGRSPIWPEQVNALLLAGASFDEQVQRSL